MNSALEVFKTEIENTIDKYRDENKLDQNGDKELAQTILEMAFIAMEGAYGPPHGHSMVRTLGQQRYKSLDL